MKKYLLMASAATLLLGSCADDLGVKPNQEQVLEGVSKIVATYPIEAEPATRTSAVQNSAGTGFNYVWNAGDQLSVISENVYNSTYTTLSTTAQGSFSGQIHLVPGQVYYAVYPRLDGKYTSAAIPFTINQTQQFNWNASQGENAQGSFAQNEAPGIAVSTAVEGSNELNMTFNAVASYLRFPVVGVGNITNVKLSITNSEGIKENLAGTVDLNLANYKTNAEIVSYLNSESLIPTISEGEEANNIDLQCAGGALLDVDTPTYFWFLVPAGLELASATVTLTFTPQEGEDITLERVLPSTVSNTARGGLKTIAQTSTQEENNYWQVVDPNTYLIRTPLQFLEYAYLVSNEKAVSNWQSMYANEAYASILGYSNLPYMVNTNNGDLLTNKNTVESVKKALIVSSNGILDLSVSNVDKLLGQLQGGYETTSEYYRQAFFSYVNNGYIPTIGGAQTFTMSGNGVTTAGVPKITLSGLVTNGPVFNGGVTGKMIWLKNLNLTVSAINHAFLGTTYIAEYNNIVINDGSKVLPSVTGTQYAYEDGYVFAEIQSSQLYTGIKPITNNSGYQFANYLNINNTTESAPDYNTFEFLPNKGMGVEDFNQINVTKVDRVIVNGQEEDKSAAVLLISKVEAYAAANKNAGTQPYSVLDKTTSYWTGYTIAPNYWGQAEDMPGTAEQLAAIVRTDAGGTFYFGKYNLDLMGGQDITEELTYSPKTWYATTSNAVTVNGVIGNNSTINNVYINGTNGKLVAEKAHTPYQTLLGATAAVYDITLNNVLIDNTVGDYSNAIIGAIAGWPLVSEKASNPIVNGLTVKTNTAYYENTAGGLYAIIGINNISTVDEKSSLNWATDGNTGVDKNLWGNFAGLFAINLAQQTSSVDSPIRVFNNANPFAGYNNLSSQYVGMTKLTVSQPKYGTGDNYASINYLQFGYQPNNLYIVPSKDYKPTKGNDQVWVKVGNKWTTYMFNGTYFEEWPK